MAFMFPELIKKDTDLESLDDGLISYWHEKMHIIWSRIEEGLQIPEWNFSEVYKYHQKIVQLMDSKGIKHLVPINSLDLIKEE